MVKVTIVNRLLACCQDCSNDFFLSQSNFSIIYLPLPVLSRYIYLHRYPPDFLGGPILPHVLSTQRRNLLIEMGPEYGSPVLHLCL